MALSLSTPNYVNYDEYAVGENHPTEDDTINRPMKTIQANVETVRDALSYQNLIRNPFAVCSHSTLENNPDKAQITLSDVTAGVCSTANTQTIAEGDLFRFDSGDFNGETYKVTSVTANTSFTLNDTSLTDSGTPGTGYEVVPAFVAADINTFDLWRKNSTIDIYRMFAEDQFTQHSELYMAKSVPAAQNDYHYFINGLSTAETFLERYRGRTVTIQAKVISSTASDIKLSVYDGSDYTESTSAHTGGGTEETMELTVTLGVAITGPFFGWRHTNASPGAAYITDFQISLAPAIGEGNYQPPPPHWVPFPSNISVIFTSLSAATISANATYDIEVESEGAIPLTALRIAGALQGVAPGTTDWLAVGNGNAGNLLIMSTGAGTFRAGGDFFTDGKGGMLLLRNDTFTGVTLWTQGVFLN